MKVKIIGAGSIGCHLAQAARRMNWQVVIVDNDLKALERIEKDIYPARYGTWDSEIKLFHADLEPKGGFDIIAIGTPPDIRIKLALAAMEEKPRLLHLEKPLCEPKMTGVNKLENMIAISPEIIVTVGYDHAVAESIEAVVWLLRQKRIGEIITIDVEFREHWQGIFNAHSWLSGPQDSYLGYWQRGGGAGNEHSHALHLWLYLAEIIGWSSVKEARTMLDMCDRRHENKCWYDQMAMFLLKTKDGRIGRVVQDVVTYPTRKWIKIQGLKGFIEWQCGSIPQGDVVVYQTEDMEQKVESVFEKTRPDDFYRLMLHYQKLLKGEIKKEESPLSFSKGLEVMLLLNQAYYSA